MLNVPYLETNPDLGISILVAWEDLLQSVVAAVGVCCCIPIGVMVVITGLADIVDSFASFTARTRRVLFAPLAPVVLEDKIIYK